jgi:mannosyltransferase
MVKTNTEVQRHPNSKSISEILRVGGSVWSPTLVVGLAAVLRLYHLTWKSIDNDESFSWATTHKPVAQILFDSFTLHGDIHPPVYWLTLKAWIALAGDSEVSLRLISACAGIVYVALVFQLGQRLLSRTAALAAAMFTALSPFLIWNSQDARMYTLGGTFALTGILFLIIGLQRGEWRWWAGYFIFTLLACYTHLAGTFLIPFEGLWLIINASRFRQSWWRGLLAFVGVGLAYLPYALNVWRESGPGINITRYALSYDQLLHNATLLLSSYNGRLSVLQQWISVLFIGVIFLLGVLFGREVTPSTAASTDSASAQASPEPSRRDATPRWFGRGLALLFYFVPLGVIAILSIREPIYQPKSLTFIGAALALGVGAGWAQLWQWQRVVGMLAGLGIIGIQVYGVAALWIPENLKEDWRHAAAYVAEQRGTNDTVIVHLEYYQSAFSYYFREAAPVVAPFGSHLPEQASLEVNLQKFSGEEVIWLAQAGEFLTDPEHRVQRWLETHYPEVTEVYPSGVLVKGFAATYRTPTLPAYATPLTINYSNGLTLVGYRVPVTQLPVNDIWLHPPSTWVHATLYWSVAQPLSEDIRVAVTLEDEAGNVWGGDLPRSNDLRAFYPPLHWQPGEIIRQDFDVNTNPALAPGEYKVVLRVYRLGDEAPLATESGSGPDWVILQRVILQ